jgi:hypothetical protein
LVIAVALVAVVLTAGIPMRLLAITAHRARRRRTRPAADLRGDLIVGGLEA